MDTVLIDIDGTLLDSNYHHVVAWTRAFRSQGLDVEAWRVHRAIGMGGDRLVAHVAGDEAELRAGDAIRKAWEAEYDGMIDDTRLLDGAIDLVDACRARGLAVALASSAIPRHAAHALDLLDAELRADAWTTAEDAEESKPDPELLDAVLDRVDGHRAVMVGDTVWDVRAAAQRGIPTIGLLCGGISRAELEGAGAGTIRSGPADLAAHLGEALEAVGHGR